MGLYRKVFPTSHQDSSALILWGFDPLSHPTSRTLALRGGYETHESSFGLLCETAIITSVWLRLNSSKSALFMFEQLRNVSPQGQKMSADFHKIWYRGSRSSAGWILLKIVLYTKPFPWNASDGRNAIEEERPCWPIDIHFVRCYCHNV